MLLRRIQGQSRLKGLLSSSYFKDKSNCFSVLLHPCLGKAFVEWTMFLDTLLNVVEGLYPALAARITIPCSLSAQPTLWLGRLHQSQLNTDVTPDTRLFMTSVMDNMVPMDSKTFKGFFVVRWSFELLHQLVIQLCTLGILMMPCMQLKISPAS